MNAVARLGGREKHALPVSVARLGGLEKHALPKIITVDFHRMSFSQQFALIFIRLLAICLMLAAGFLARRRHFLDDDSTRRLSLLVTNLIYPAAIFSSLVSKFTLRGIASEWVMPAGTLLIIAIGYSLGHLLSFVSRGSPDATRRMFHFQCAVNNYIFLPLPLAIVFWPETGLAKMALSTVGSEIGVWSIGILALTGFSFQLQTFRKLLSAPMLAILAAIAIMTLREILPMSLPPEGLLHECWQALLSVGEMLGNATVPLAMIIAGSRMANLKVHNLHQPLQYWLLVARLIIIPAITIPLLIFLLPLDAESRFLLVLIAVMPCSVASVAFSEIYQADSDFAAASVLLTTLICMITVPFWLAIMG